MINGDGRITLNTGGPTPRTQMERKWNANKKSTCMLFEGVSYVYYRHPSPRRVWTGGSEAQSGTQKRGIRWIRRIRRRIPGMAIQCTGMRLLACFPVKDLQIFMIFKGRPREEAQGSPRRPKGGQGAPKGAKKSPRGPPRGAKRSSKRCQNEPTGTTTI